MHICKKICIFAANFTNMKRFLYLCVCLCVCLSLSAEIKYVFYLIGDGMGSNQVLAAEMYLAELDGKIDRNRLNMSSLPYGGLVATHSHSNSITDSSAAGTALATGSKTNNGRLGIDYKGDTLTTIAETLHAQGWGVGLLTTVAIDHATPAAFYAKNTKRSDYYNIGKQLPHTGFEFFGGAGFHKPEPKHGKGVNLYDYAEQCGYTLAGGVEQAKQLSKDHSKLILVPARDTENRKLEDENLHYVIDDRPEEMMLRNLTPVAIDHLAAHSERFFLMIEGGMIDYAGHGQDGATDILEVLDFDEAVSAVLAFYSTHSDETLIVITADHETGGMSLATVEYVLNLQVLKHQHCSSAMLSDELNKLFKSKSKPSWTDVRAILERWLDFFSEVKLSAENEAELQAAYRQAVRSKGKASVKTLYKDINTLSNTAVAILNRQAHLGWTSYGHSAASVPIFAIGSGAEQFTGWMDNTEIVPRIINAIQSSKISEQY